MCASLSGPRPDDVRALERPEHLLVWSLRALAMGHGDCPVVRRAFTAACGEAGEQTLAAYACLIELIGLCARRRLTVHMPGCVCLSADELCVVEVVAAAQLALRTYDYDRLGAHVAWLVESHAAQCVSQAALAVADGLAAGGRVLPLRSRARTITEAQGLRSIH